MDKIILVVRGSKNLQVHDVTNWWHSHRAEQVYEIKEKASAKEIPKLYRLLDTLDNASCIANYML